MDILNECKESFKNVVDSFKQTLNKMSVGKATNNFLDDVLVDPYNSGSMSPLKSFANINVQDASTLIVKVWDAKAIDHIVKTINNVKARFNILAKKNNNFIVVSFPPMTESFRAAMAVQISELMQNKKLLIDKKLRPGFVKQANQLESSMGKDHVKRVLEEINKYKDQYIKELLKISDIKKKEIMTL